MVRLYVVRVCLFATISIVLGKSIKQESASTHTREGNPTRGFLIIYRFGNLQRENAYFAIVVGSVHLCKLGLLHATPPAVGMTFWAISLFSLLVVEWQDCVIKVSYLAASCKYERNLYVRNVEKSSLRLTYHEGKPERHSSMGNLTKILPSGPHDLLYLSNKTIKPKKRSYSDRAQGTRRNGVFVQ